MTLSPFQASKLVEWAEHVLINGPEPGNMPRGIKQAAVWVMACGLGFSREPFPKFDTEQPYTWEG